MYCLRCGREIPDGELFCQECAKKPLERELPPQPVRPVRVPPPVHTEDVMPPEPAEKPQKKRNRLLIPFLLLCAFMVLLGAFTVYVCREMKSQKASYRVMEADLSRRDAELSSLQSDYDAVKAQLDEANTDAAAQKETIADLKKQLTEQQSAASQNEYDAEAAKKTIETLQGEKDELTTENEALQKELDETKTKLETAQSSLTDMTSKYNKVKAKADFMDTYVVFVNNNGTKYYHCYDCADFTKSNFWAYSRKLAENYGYTACPNCGG